MEVTSPANERGEGSTLLHIQLCIERQRERERERERRESARAREGERGRQRGRETDYVCTMHFFRAPLSSILPLCRSSNVSADLATCARPDQTVHYESLVGRIFERNVTKFKPQKALQIFA